MLLVRLLTRTLFIPVTAPFLTSTANHYFSLHSSLLSAKTPYHIEDIGPNHSMDLSESREAFIKWAVQNAIPINCLQPNRSEDDDNDQSEPFLSYLSEAILAASVVLLSEGFHNCKEMMSLHHRIIQHLSVHCGFRLVATESGMPEARDIADYVIPLDNDYDSNSEDEMLWNKGLNKMYSAWSEGRGLIEWMKEYNSNKMRHQEMLAYCGLDIGGFYSDWNYPLSKIRSYLKGHLPDFEEEWSRQMKPMLDVMGNVQARYNYQHLLTPAQKSTLAVLLDYLVIELNSHRGEFEGDVEFEWAKQSAISMQLAENYYRNYENMSLAQSDTGMISKYSGLNGREIAMANNMIWRLNLEEKDATRKTNGKQKMVIVNHIIHTKTSTTFQGDIWGHFVPMGQLMKQILTTDQYQRREMFNIAMIYGSGTFWNKWQKPHERFIDTCPPPKDNGLESVMKQVSKEAKMPNLFLHWELAPKEAWIYLNEVSTIRENDYFIQASPNEWNGCIYLDKVSHATPV